MAISMTSWARKRLSKLKTYKSIALLPQINLAPVCSFNAPAQLEVVLAADIACVGCRKRILDAISSLPYDMESVMVHVNEKKVTLTCGSDTTRGSAAQI